MQRHGFSLIELSIVLIILGLVAGGALMSQNLIRNAELRNTLAELDRYNKGYIHFREKYQSVPGDMFDATDAWGVRAGTTGSDATCRNTKGSYSGTCNGDGNNMVDQPFERFLFWQHLARAELVEGRYTGASSDATDSGRTPGVNTPLLSLGKIYFIQALFLGTPSAADTQQFNVTFNANLLWIGDSALKPEELWSIDRKIDDGKPASGTVRTLKASASWGPNCANSDAASSAAYNTTNSAKTCALLYLLD